MEIWAWSAPLGLGAFIVAIALSIALLSLAGRWGSSVAPTRRNRR